MSYWCIDIIWLSNIGLTVRSTWDVYGYESCWLALVWCPFHVAIFVLIRFVLLFRSVLLPRFGLMSLSCCHLCSYSVRSSLPLNLVGSLWSDVPFMLPSLFLFGSFFSSAQSCCLALVWCPFHVAIFVLIRFVLLFRSILLARFGVMSLSCCHLCSYSHRFSLPLNLVGSLWSDVPFMLPSLFLFGSFFSSAQSCCLALVWCPFHVAIFVLIRFVLLFRSILLARFGVMSLSCCHLCSYSCCHLCSYSHRFSLPLNLVGSLWSDVPFMLPSLFLFGSFFSSAQSCCLALVWCPFHVAIFVLIRFVLLFRSILLARFGVMSLSCCHLCSYSHSHRFSLPLSLVGSLWSDVPFMLPSLFLFASFFSSAQSCWLALVWCPFHVAIFVLIRWWKMSSTLWVFTFFISGQFLITTREL